MDSLSRLFRTSVRWNTLGAVGYQTLLVVHQAALYKLMPLAMYGTMSVLLSLSYFGAVIADCGLDATLAPFFKRLTTSRTTFTKTLFPHWISIAATATLLALFFAFFQHHFFTTQQLSPIVIIATASIMLAESFRRSLRMLLQLSFKAKTASLLDIGSIVTYLAGVWGAYAFGITLSLELLLGFLALASMSCTLMMGLIMYRWQKKLSDIDPATELYPKETSLKQGVQENVSTERISAERISAEKISQRHFITSRFVNGGNALTHQLFSGNILVPLVSMSSGLANAGLVKLASYLAHGLVTVIRKIVGLSGSALLAALKNAPWQTKRPAFWHLSRTLYTTIFFSIIALTSMSSHLVAQEVITSTQSSIIVLVIFLILSESLCISYETLFVIEEKALYATALNGTTGLLAALILISAPALPLITSLTFILGLRLALFGAMALVATNLWQLYPPRPTITRTLLTRTTLLAGLAYLCGSPLALLLAR